MGARQLFFIFIIFLHGLAPASLADTANENANISAFESKFAHVSAVVKSQLREAPDASLLYLDHWINVYNETARASRQPVFNLRPEAPLTPDSAPTYEPSNDQTAWRPNGLPIISPRWASARPISLIRAEQFRPPPPPQIGSDIFTRDIESVFRIGEKYGEYNRPIDGSVMAAFWADGLGTVTPPGRWNLIALEHSRDWPEARRAALMLLLNIALYDAGIAAWDSKYYYKYWRPKQAITQLYPEHADWQSMMSSPFHPEYVSGHSTFSGAAATILQSLIGPREFCVASDELLGLTRCFTSFTHAAEEAGQSRIFGGIHYEFSNIAGQTLGQNIANNVLARFDQLASAARGQPR